MNGMTNFQFFPFKKKSFQVTKNNDVDSAIYIVDLKRDQHFLTIYKTSLVTKIFRRIQLTAS